MAPADTGVIRMRCASGPRIANPEILQNAAGRTAQTATNTDDVFLNQVGFTVNGILGQGDRPTGQERESSRRIIGNVVAGDIRRTGVGDVDAPDVDGDRVVEDIGIGAAPDGDSASSIVINVIACSGPGGCWMVVQTGPDPGIGALVHQNSVGGIVFYGGAFDDRRAAAPNMDACAGAILNGYVLDSGPELGQAIGRQRDPFRR